jgi:hypothetical protein
LELCGETMAISVGDICYNTNNYHIPYSWQYVERFANDYYFDKISISKFYETTNTSSVVSYIFENPLHATTYQKKKHMVFNADGKGINALADLNGYENT